MPRVAVVIPWQESDPYRRRALEWVRDRYRSEFPDWEIIVAPGPTPWCKAVPVMRAARSTTADVLVIADADVWTTGLSTAADAVLDGEAWGMPHTLVKRLTPAATERLTAGELVEELDEKAYHGIPGGGITILPRPVLLDVPMDARFIGWGQEDEAFGVALTAIYGPGYRAPDDLIHLWHPPQERSSRVRGNADGWRLRRRYLKARHDPKLLRVLLEEAHDHLASPHPDLHDHQPQLVG